jgi:hypothetical protein
MEIYVHIQVRDNVDISFRYHYHRWRCGKYDERRE